MLYRSSLTQEPLSTDTAFEISTTLDLQCLLLMHDMLTQSGAVWFENHSR